MKIATTRARHRMLLLRLHLPWPSEQWRQGTSSRLRCAQAQSRCLPAMKRQHGEFLRLPPRADTESLQAKRQILVQYCKLFRQRLCSEVDRLKTQIARNENTSIPQALHLEGLRCWMINLNYSNVL